MNNDPCEVMNYGVIQHWFNFLFSFTQGHVSIIQTCMTALEMVILFNILEIPQITKTPAEFRKHCLNDCNQVVKL